MSEPLFNGPLAILLRRFSIHSPPDPWPLAMDAAVRAPDAIPLCSECLHPQAPHRWFCPHCRCPTGDYVPVMPYLQIFCVGEFLRRGVTGPGKNTASQNAGFALLGLIQYSLFVPIYWYWLVAKAAGQPICVARREPLRDALLVSPAETESDS